MKVTLSFHARQRLMERRGVTLSGEEVRAICNSIESQIDPTEIGDRAVFEVALPERALKFRAIVTLPRGVIVTVLPGFDNPRNSKRMKRLAKQDTLLESMMENGRARRARLNKGAQQDYKRLSKLHKPYKRDKVKLEYNDNE